MNQSTDALVQLMETIESRKKGPPQKSYTQSLLDGGVSKIGAKIVEEAHEVVEAADEHSANPDSDSAARQHVVHECADLIYHLFVLMAHQDVSLNDVQNELARRFGISGIDEKASRKKAPE